MTASVTMYQSANVYLGNGSIQLGIDTLKVSLHTSTYVPNAATQTVYADLTNELSTADGYTSGGVALGSVTWNNSTVTATLDAADASWAATGSGITARYAVIRSTATHNGHVEPLLAYILLDVTPANVTATAGNNFVLQWNASGIMVSTIV